MLLVPIVGRGQGCSETTYDVSHNREMPTVPRRLRNPDLVQWFSNFSSQDPFILLKLRTSRKLSFISCSLWKMPPHMQGRITMKKYCENSFDFVNPLRGPPEPVESLGPQFENLWPGVYRHSSGTGIPEFQPQFSHLLAGAK